MTPERLARSYEHCKHVAKTQARNFYFSFLTLPAEKRAAMCAVYAFMRYSDDVSDEASLSGSRHDLLPRWRAALDRAFEGDYGDSLILPAFHDTACRYAIPIRFFHELIDGVEMDLTRTRYETFEELYRYCYHVASVVGLVCLHVWGVVDDEDTGFGIRDSVWYDGRRTMDDPSSGPQPSTLNPQPSSIYAPAEACGIAFQLTNILRDVQEDVERDRVYLPQEDLRRFGVTEADLRHGAVDDRFRALMKFEAARAREYYEKALPLLPRICPDSRPTFAIMFRIYRGLLERIEAQDYDVFSRRARLSTPRKLGIVARAWLESRLGRGKC